MTALSIQVPYQIFADSDGTPLDNGYVWIGTTNLDPRTNPINVYFDAALTQVAPNPIRTVNGYVYNAGSPAQLYIDGVNFSIRVEDKKSVLVYSFPSGSGISPNADGVVYLPAGTGAVATTVADELNEFLHVNNFTGVDPIGVSDSLTGLQAAIDAGVAAGKRVIGRGTYKISGKLVFKGDADFSQANVVVTDAPAIALEVSTGNASNPTTILYNSNIWLPKTVTNSTKPVTGWAGQGIGVRVVNAYNCRVFFGNMLQFATNIQITSYGTGNSYNDYFLGHMENGQINIDLSPGNAASWVNENNFYGGRFSHYSAEGSNISGTRHIYISNGLGNVPNNNIFYKPSIEGDTAEFHAEIGGSYITLLQARWEATTPKLRYFGTTTNHGTRNVVLGGYDAQSIIVSTSGTTGGNNKLNFAGGGFESVSGGGIGMQNQTSSSSAIYKYYEAGTAPETAGASDWSYQAGSAFVAGKRKADANARIKLDFINGKLLFDNGVTASPTAGFGAFGANSVACFSHLYTGTDNSFTCGVANFRWSIVHATTLSPGTTGTTDATRVKWSSGTGTPEGVLTAIVGSMYTRTDGGAGTTLYIKETGSGNTGWVAK